jgi:thiol:disulfide interchange protein DsbC
MSAFSRFVVLLVALVAGIGASTAALAEEGAVQRLEALFTELANGRAPDAIEPTPLEGFYMVRFGTQVLYATQDGRYLIEGGSLVDLTARRNLTEEAVSGARIEIMNAIPESQMVVFSPKDPKHTVTVFTDVNCGYCRKMHSEIDQYLERGIKVRYVFFPLGGPQSKSYETMVSVWCADDRNDALTQAKAGKTIPTRTCDNPTERHLQTALELGVRSTPTLMLEGGEVVPGYRPAAELAALLERPQAVARP